MKNLLISLFLSTFILFSVNGCDDHELFEDVTPPSAPKNVMIINGDNRVDIMWDMNRESDLNGYNIYFSYDDYKFELIGHTEDNYYIDYDATNGELYYYAVTAYDFDGNESELSRNSAPGIARPEGFNQSIFDFNISPDLSGYDLSEYLIVAFDDVEHCDFFFEKYNGTFYINVWTDTDIQDMGATNDIYDIGYAPTDGWVELIEGDNVKYAEVVVGNTYVIWTWDNHFAKIRVKQITGDRMVFDWAYQLVEGEVLLKGLKNKSRREITDKKVEVYSRK